MLNRSFHLFCAGILFLLSTHHAMADELETGGPETGGPVSDGPVEQSVAAGNVVEPSEMAGYLLVPNDKMPKEYDAGFSMYVAAWPLLSEYPGRRFQTGLFGTWMHAQYDTPRSKEDKLYSDIEGGLGWWRDTRFATETPKFIMGGVARSFSAWANGPGAGKGRNWDKPQGKYGVAQLSPWLLWPPDGVNLKQGTSGELFGYGYLPLPLTEPKATTAGQDVPTGNQSWTLFLNSGNFKGPAAFFTPYFWTRPSLKDPGVAELFLDTRPSNPNRALQMETQYVPSVQATDSAGVTYARVAPTSFPRKDDGNSAVVHRVTSYKKQALWDRVESWFAGGEVVSGKIDSSQAVVHQFPGRGGATWKIYPPGTKRDDKIPLDWTSFATPIAIDSHTFGFSWNDELVKHDADAKLVTLPEYFRLSTGKKGKPQWVVVDAKDIPAETGLLEHRFSAPEHTPTEPYVTPDEPESCWKTPGPVAGPFYAYPGDGSKVTYFWYRFADQPALLNADLTDAEREALQMRVQKLHASWTKERDYLPAPKIGQLADIDAALIVAPPKGLEAGYVPIVTRQELAVDGQYSVAEPPAELKLDPFYTKYVDASGYPIVGSARVNDYALKEAAHLVDMMLASRPDVRRAMVDSGSRLIVMAHDEFTTDIPEHSHLKPKDYWDARARGLGGSRDEPVCSCGEENLLAFSGDPYSTENILIHEFAHNIHLRGMVNLDPTFDDRLRASYDRAMANGLWKTKYASTNHSEYFAEGVQSWFDNNRQPDHDHNHVDTRVELKEYDPGLAAICEEVFGTTELVYTKPGQRLTGHLAGYDPTKSPAFSWPKRLKESQQKIRDTAKDRGANRKVEYKN
ncbi:hypothetical protein [Stieleria marina]|uniref:Secreted protein n=1 Tax=Stieleria marina TaxID=1930275 RepID=A0A517NYM5_9BACT|nr:hypothetical protein K239x_42390 [Planctomycetes bacterium K23_9]